MPNACWCLLFQSADYAGPGWQSVHYLTPDCDKKGRLLNPSRPSQDLIAGGGPQESARIPRLSARLRRLGINSQHLHQLRYLAEMPQRVARVLVVAAQQVHEKHVLPRTPAHGPRFNLA